MLHTTIQQVVTDNDFASQMILPQLSVYIIYRGGPKVEYYAFRDQRLLFSGADYRPSPLHDIDGKESIIDLLGFLTVRQGDTDPEYFASYTPDQLDWTASRDCDDLALLISDYENEDSTAHKEAVQTIESAFTYGITQTTYSL